MAWKKAGGEIKATRCNNEREKVHAASKEIGGRIGVSLKQNRAAKRTIPKKKRATPVMNNEGWGGDKFTGLCRTGPG